LGNNSSSWYRRRGTIIVVGLLLVAGAVVAYMRWFGSRGDASTVSAATAIPSAEVIRGELVDIVELRGQIRPLHSVDLLAPPDAGAIQILKLVKDGDTVKKGDVVIVFDPSTIQMTLNQRSSDLKQAEAQVDDARAKQKLAEQQDLTDLQKANYDVERAKLDASQAEILSQIDGEEKKLALADAEQKAKQVQQKLDSDRASNKADLSNIDQKRKKAQLDVQHYEDAVSRLTIHAPADGMVHLMPNWRAGGNFGQNAPPFKEGDRAWPMAGIAQLPDLSALRITAHLDEEDRGRLHAGETVSARVDAVTDMEFTGTVADISPLAKIDFSGGWPPVKNFDLVVALDHLDPRLRVGMSVTERIAVQRIPNVILVPSEALFTRNGRDVVYVEQGAKGSNNFNERDVVIGHRGGGQIEIRGGLQPGVRVALKDPVAKP
jgi:multidrug efflux pump subunit AcrA (membrane-fusion protein)